MHKFIILPAMLAAALAFPSLAHADCTNPDADGDGHARIECGGDDCDDGDPARYPGNVEVCDTRDRDEDCDLSTAGIRDSDGDGYVDDSCRNLDSRGNVASGGDDCDDMDAATHPNQEETCNYIDTDCNGVIDDGGETGGSLQRDYWVDGDGDGFGAGAAVSLCFQDTEGYAPQAGDCDDASNAIVPGAQICSGMGTVDVCESDGAWTTLSCGTGQLCLDQPNELGTCYVEFQQKKVKKPKKDDDDDSSDD